jgi:hypothetical protein
MCWLTVRDGGGFHRVLMREYVVIPLPLLKLKDVVGRVAAVDATQAVKMHPNQVNISQTATLFLSPSLLLCGGALYEWQYKNSPNRRCPAFIYQPFSGQCSFNCVILHQRAT